MRRSGSLLLPLQFLVSLCLTALAPAGEPPARNAWYWDSVVNLHIDNHSSLVGQGHTVDQIAALLRDLPVDAVQVSAYGAVGNSVTYPTARLPELLPPQLAGHDTLALWRDAAAACGKRFHVYLNTRGLMIHRQHPGWMQQDASGTGHGRGPGLYDACARPSPDGDGYLERILLPLLEEVSERYRPGGFWIDGDHARTPVCYCKNCREAWRRRTGKSEPPAEAGAPGWPDWLRLEQERYDEYRRLMAETIHRANSAAMVTSNHSWRKTFSPRFEKIDPRDPPAFADATSADLSHGNVISPTRLSAMLLSADETTPHDIMHLVNSDGISPGCVLQQGALTLSFGGPWFLWVSGTTITQPAARERVRVCAQFARARAGACGRSVSRNPYAVLVSETTWQMQREGAADVAHDFLAANHFALALQDAACGVDLVNESLLRQRAAAYRCVVVPNQSSLAPGTIQTLEHFAREGGAVLLTGGAMRPPHGEDPATAQFFGLRRDRHHAGAASIRIDGRAVEVEPSWDVTVGQAEIVAKFDDGRPALTRVALGRSSVFWLNLDSLPSLERNGVIPWVMTQIGCGPCFRIDAPEDLPHVVMATRRKGDRTILHLTDLTARVAGQRVLPDSTNFIDDPAPIEQIRVVIPAAKAPSGVGVLPADASVSHSWKDGMLSLTLRNLRVHAAVLLDGLPDEPASLLPPATPVARRFAWANGDIARVIKAGFEVESQGHRLNPFAECTVRESGTLTIRATSEAASEGASSAKFTDGPDEKGYLPCLLWQPTDLTSGTVKLSADLRLGDGSCPSIELRTVENRRANPVGPSLRFGPDGTLRTEQGKVLLAAPHEQWTRIELSCELGSGRYDLRVSIPGQEPQEFRDLPCVGGTDFKRCGWIGICSNARANSVFYLDNLRVEGARATE